MLNFLSIIPYKIHPPTNGGHKGISIFTEYLAQQTHLTAFGVTTNDSTFKKSYPFRYILSPSKFRYINIFLFYTVSHYIKKNKINYFITEHPYYGWLGYLLQRFTPAKWIVHSHNIEHERFRDFGKPWWKILKYYETWVYRKANFVLCKTPEDKSKIAQLTGQQSTLIDLPYGIEIDTPPLDRDNCAEQIRTRYSIPIHHFIFLFNGALDYIPNRNALDKILHHINPLLIETGLPYTILICGSKLPHAYNELKGYADKNIIYCGFVDDISIYFKAADIFLNPTISGGGIKTKLVEALAWNCNVVSTQNGAIGIQKNVCGNKLCIVDDNDNEAFVTAIVENTQMLSNIPSSFYAYYNWPEIITRFLQIIVKH